MNMLVNAGQAIDSFGTIALTSRPVEDWVEVSITDASCGISKEGQARIFDPFYTTKDVGKGTGLGLSISYSIVKQYGDRIEVDSQLNRGTCFRIFFPLKVPKASGKEWEMLAVS